MCHIEVPPPQERDRARSAWISLRGSIGVGKRWLYNDLQARGGGLVEQMVPAADDDRDLELTRIERRRSPQREYASATLQPCDEGYHP